MSKHVVYSDSELLHSNENSDLQPPTAAEEPENTMWHKVNQAQGLWPQPGSHLVRSAHSLHDDT